MKKFITALLIWAVAFALPAGCGKQGAASEGADGNGLDAAAIVAKSVEATAGFTNYTATLVSEIELSSPSQSVTMTMNSFMDVFLDPFKIRIQTESNLPLEGMGGDDCYIFTEGENLVTYTFMNGNWYKSSQPSSDGPLAGFGMSQNCQTLNNSLKKADIVDVEQIDGASCWKIEAMIDPAASMELLKGIQGSQDLDALLPDDADQSTDDVPTTLWISTSNFYLVRMDIDMAFAFAPGLENSAGGIKILKMNLSETTANYGNATDFTLPDEARNAQTIEGVFR